MQMACQMSPLLARFQAYFSFMGYCVCKIRISGLESWVGLHVAGFVCGLFFCWCVCWGFCRNPPLKTFVFLPEGEAGPAAEA